MVRKEIIGGSIAAAIAIIFVLVLTTTTVPEIQEKQFIKTDPTYIVDFGAVQYENELSLTMSLGDDVPQDISDIPLSESALGFAYGWFGINKQKPGEEVEGRGPNHLIGYIVSMYHDDIEPDWKVQPDLKVGPGWKVEPVLADIILGHAPIDYCVRFWGPPAEVQIVDNTLSLKTFPDTAPILNAFFVDRAVSLEILGHSLQCHGNQFAAHIIDENMSE